MSKQKNLIAIVFFLLSLVFMLPSLVNSGALSNGRIERAVVANVVDDSYGILELKGFSNEKVYDIDKDYERIGSISNRSNTTIELNITVSPDFSLVKNKNLWNSIKIGDEVMEFTFEQQSPKQVEVQIQPGQTVQVDIAVSHNHSRIITASFEVRGSDGVFNVTLGSLGSRQIMYQ